MRNTLRRPALIIFFLVSVGVLAFGGGQGGSGTPPAAAPGEKTTLLIAMMANPGITDYEDNYLTQYMEKLHNINLDFYMLPQASNEAATKVALMVSSGDLTDILLTGGLSREAILNYGTNGAFIPLNKYFNDPAKTKNFLTVPAEDRKVLLDGITSADGNIYTLARYSLNPWNFTPYRIYINREWIEKLGLKMPANTDELRTILTAFRDRDPNGNGKKDEIPIYGQYSGSYGENVVVTLINSFLFYYPGNLALDASGNRVVAPFVDPAFRKALVYISGLCKDELLAGSVFTDNTQQFKALLNNDPPLVGFTSAGSNGNWTNAVANKNLAQLDMIGPIPGPEGKAFTPRSTFVPDAFGIITSKCAKPDAAWALLESFYDQKNGAVALCGEEGVDWSKKPEDLDKAINGYIDLGVIPRAGIVEINDRWNGPPHNKTWHDINPIYRGLDMTYGRVGLTNPYDPNNRVSQFGAIHYKLYTGKYPEKILPFLRYSLDDAQALSEPITNVNEYVKQAIAEFVSGTRDINSDSAWNTYLKDLNNMGLEQWLKAAQTAYERQK
jgi:putative aldouronate transport system substrate-binding protein